MLPTKESLTVEFKSERQRPQTDDEIVDNVVAMANTEGGTLYLGVEDDGMVTGVCDRHRNVNGLAAFIFNKTVPQLSVRVTLLSESGKPVVGIEVDSSQQIVSTSQGKTLQRRLKADGAPEVVPMFLRNSSVVCHSSVVTTTARSLLRGRRCPILIRLRATVSGRAYARPMPAAHCWRLMMRTSIGP